MVKQIIKIEEMKLTDIVISKGRDSYCIFARVQMPRIRQINITYDCMEGNLVVHEWYRLDKNKIDEIYAKFMEFIKMVGRRDCR